MADVPDLDLDFDIGGIPMPWWLVAMSDQVTTVTYPLEDGSELKFTFEAFIFTTQTTTVYCTYPRYACWLTRPNPEHECRWSHPTWNETAMIEHAKIHVDDALASRVGAMDGR